MRFSARNLLIVLVLFILFLTFTGAFFIVNETKLTSRNHLHALIQIPEDETYDSFVCKLTIAAIKTKETLANTLHTTHIQEANSGSALPRCR